VDILRRRRIAERRAARALAAVLAAVLSAGPAAGTDLTPGMITEAARIQAALDRIGAKADARAAAPMKNVSFTERELNSWLAVLLEMNRDNVLRELALKLLDDNRVEGMALVDLSGASLPLGLKPRLTVLFSGQVVVRDGAARIELDRLFLGEQAVPLVLLDAVIAAAAALGKGEAGSIRDWVALPAGIRDLRGYKGKLTLYY